MKIISKHKDYYDYLAGINGIDEKLILDRSKFFPTSTYMMSEGDLLKFYICGWIIEVIYTNEKFYCGELLKQVAIPFEERRSKWWQHDGGTKETHYRIKLKAGTALVHKVPYKYGDENINELLDCPILLLNSKFWGKTDLTYRGSSYHRFPVLKDYNIGSALPPEQIWQLLYDFLARTRDIPNKQTDKEKIVSHGFDIKHSFRNTK